MTLFLLVLVVSLLEPGRMAWGQAGEFVAVRGRVETRTEGRWQALMSGAVVGIGERVRVGTGAGGKLLLPEGSLVEAASSTEFVVDESTGSEGESRAAVSIRLFEGVVLSRSSQGEGDARSFFEIETAQGIVSGRGVEFVVEELPARQVSVVTVLRGQAEVAGKVGVLGGGKVLLGDGDSVEVRRGRLPAVAVRRPEEDVRRLVERVEVVGTGKGDGLHILRRVSQGELWAAADVPRRPSSPGAGVWPSWPGLPGLAPTSQRSLDVYTNSQPLPVFRRFPPGALPPGGVRVTF